MFKSTTTKLSRTNGRTRSITAAISGLALAMVLSGSAMAYQPTRDLPDGLAAQAASPLDRGLGSEGWIEAKLKTTAGYKVLVLE
jgi:hypothetical protein